LTQLVGAALTRAQQARQRNEAEAKVGNRDAILQAVTDSAANLLNAQDLDKAITETLAALGPTLGLSRIYVTPLTLTADRRVLMNVSHEWFKPGMIPTKAHPGLSIPMLQPDIRLKKWPKLSPGGPMPFLPRTFRRGQTQRD